MLKRFHASGIPAWEIAASQVAVAMVFSFVSGGILVAVAALIHDFDWPQSVAAVIGVLPLLVLGFSALGILLGAVLPNARAAEAAGLLLSFALLQLGGAGPPPEVLTEGMPTFGDFTPMLHAVQMMQDAWLGLDAGLSWLIFGGISVVGVVLAMAFFRWE